MIPIKSRTDLKEIFDSLYDQGFGYFKEYEAHNSKVDKIIHEANTQQIKEFEESKLRDRLQKMNNYEEIKEETITHFAKYSPEDKIKELMDKFYIHANEYASVPSYTRPSDVSIIAWHQFKRKFGLTDKNINEYATYKYYDLDKNLKINFSGTYEFRKLCELVNGTMPPEIETKSSDWKNLGDFQVRIFNNGNAELKGNIDKFRERYFNILTKDKHSENKIIDYKGKRYKNN